MIATWSSAPRLRDALAALACAAVLAAVVPGYPLGAGWLAAALLLYGALLRRWPNAWLLLVPAALPVLDLTPWTGRFYLDEFDALLAVTVLVLAWRPPHAAPAGVDSAARRWLLLFCVSVALSLAIGAWPFPVPGLNSFNHYYSAWNGFRLARGLGWALLLWRPLRAALAQDVVKTQRRFALGMSLGVCAGALAVAWERAAFPGLFNFDSGYRVVGLFSAMHTGGACIEAYFALALPFCAWWTLASRRWPQRLAGAAMLGAGSYALLVTYARAGYLAALAALLVLALAPLLRRLRRATRRRALRAAVLAALLGSLAWTVASGGAMQRRYAHSAHDLAVRAGHWADALRMMDRAPVTWLAGMGLGRYPRTYFQRSEEGVAPTYLALRAEAGNRYVALAAGAPLYLEQLVRLEPGQRYHLRLRARSADADAQLSVPVCEKWMLYSRRCARMRFAVGDTGGAWREFDASFTRAARAPAWHGIAAPTKLSLFGEAEGSQVDIDDVSLRDGAGRELIKNGDFGAGMDRWFFTSDNHLPWHLENTWLQLAFEQGLLGLAAFAGLALCAARALLRRLRAGEPYATVLAAALAAFSVLSLLDSLFDFPRISIVVYLILLQAVFDAKKSMPQGI